LAEKTKQTIEANGQIISRFLGEFQELISSITKISSAQKMEQLSQGLVSWKAELDTLSRNLRSFNNTLAIQDQIKSFSLVPKGIADEIKTLKDKIDAAPEQSASEAANTFEVEQDFSRYYQLINSDDEGEFTAKLEPSQGKLGLKVDFYKKGMFPPGAYHSEGHQDGMGVCLYLALMKRVLGDRFKFAVLDDVVMSVDQVHRRQFCKLLKSEFPDTQFIITTHDKVWAQQMRSEGLVSGKTSIEFHSWSVDTGPIVASSEIWDKIQDDLDANDVAAAASKLRRYLEYVSREIADKIKAEVAFKADGNYDLGGLFPPIISKQKALFAKASDSAQSWGDTVATENVKSLKNTRAEAVKEYGDENWIVNKAIHFNDWDSFSKEDFQPVLDAFKKVLLTFRCNNSQCDSWLYLDARHECLRCSCNSTNLNLIKKPK